MSGTHPLRNRDRHLTKFRHASGGNVAVIFALAAIPLVGAIGVAIDFARANDVKSQMQKSLDAAVLTGVTQVSTNQISTATDLFNGDFQTKLAAAATPSFTQNSDGSLSGSATASLNLSFLSVLLRSQIPVTVNSTATPGKQATSPVCILLVNQLKSQALLVNSGAQLNAPSCEVHVVSTQSPAAIFNTTLNVKRICIKGSTIIKNGGANPPAVTSCSTISDPFANQLPTVSAGSCDYNNQTYNPGSVTINPGVYCGWTNFNGSGTLTLNPGLYIIKNGGMTFNSGWTVTGAGVTFYLVDQNATITFNGNVNASLSAPTAGTYANILMFEPTGLTNSNLPINGTSGSSFTGLLYLPSRDVTINSVSNLSSNSVTMVFSTLILNATNWMIEPGALSMSVSSGPSTGAYLSK